MEHTRELDTDHPTADTDDTLGELREMPAGVAVDHVAPINARKGRDEWHGTGGQDDFVRMKLLLRAIALCSITPGHRDGVRGIDRSYTIKDLNVVAFHQGSHTTRHTFDDFICKGNDLAHVQRRGLWEVDAQF